MEKYKITLNEAQAKAICAFIKKEINAGATLGFEKTMAPIHRNIQNAMKSNDTRKRKKIEHRIRYEENLKKLKDYVFEPDLF